MATMPPNVPPPSAPAGPPPGYDPREQRRWYRDQARAQRAAWKSQRAQFRWQMRGMRRASVLGPLLLIAVGVIFLLIQTGRIDRHLFFAFYAHWWPLLLVAAGLVVLGEWALDQFHMREPDRPQYRRSIGGAITLLLLFAFLGVAAEAGINFSQDHGDWFARAFGIGNFQDDSWAEFFGDKHEYDQTVDLPYTAGGSLTIVNPHGDVTVTGTSDDGRIHIAEHKTVYASSDSTAEDRAQQMAPKTDSEGPYTRISVHGVDGAHADLTITVPPEAAETINVDRGDIHVSSIKSSVSATTNHGSVELAAITGSASVAINSGGASISAHNLAGGFSFRGHASDVSFADIAGPVTLNGDIFGNTHIDRINGPVHFHTSRTDLQLVRLDGEFAIDGVDLSIDQAQGPVVLVTSNHNISLNRLAGDISLTNRNGSVELTAAPFLGNVTVENRNGSVKATLPEHAGFVVQADTTNGNIDNNLAFSSGSGQPEQISENRNERSLRGVVGSAADAPTVHIHTVNGDISILKGDVEPLTPPASPAKITMAPAAPSAPKASLGPKTPKAPKTPTPPATPNP